MTEFQGILLTILLTVWAIVGLLFALFLWGAVWFLKDLGDSIAIGYHRLMASMEAAAKNVVDATQNAEDATQNIEDRSKKGLLGWIK